MSQSASSLVQRIIELDDALDTAEIAHAFGGAIALAYCAEPRATRDIDINIAVAPDQARRVLQALPAGVDWSPEDLELIERDGQLRLWWDGTALDLFFAYHEFHDQLVRQARRVPFANSEIPVMRGEHLVVCKAMFDRTKDWQDIDGIRRQASTDFNTSLRWLTTMIGPGAHQVRRLQDLARRPLDGPALTGDEARARVNAVFPRPPQPPPPDYPPPGRSRR